ncbi:hypothetical protein [Lacrimispora sp.]|uniref:hypothetical protein n=1 Tax=Lacrimispora sp. TaxID=2719234 RepID=UPI0032E4BAAC
MDYIADKIRKEIEAKKDLIAQAEAAMHADPEKQKQTEELVLGILKEQLSKIKEYQQALESVLNSSEEQTKEEQDS